MSTKYIRVAVNAITKSDQTTKRIIDFTYDKTYGDSVSNAEITLKRTNTTEDDADFVTGKPVQVWMSDALVTGQVAETSANAVFSGYIEDRSIELFKITLRCADRLVLTKWSETGAKVTYGVDTSVKTIFAALVARAASETSTTINLSTDATATVPLNLNRYSTENNNVYEKMWELSNIVNWQFYYDPSDTYVAGGCIRFEPRGKPVNQAFYNKAASTGTPKDQNGNTVTWTGKSVNIVGLIGWQSDSKDLTNNLNVVGGQTEITVSSELHPASEGHPGNLYTLDDANANNRNKNTQIYNITVLADAVTLVEGVDYISLSSNNATGYIQFTFNPAISYTNLYFTYTYKFSAAAGESSSNAGSITSYLKRSKTVNKRDIVSPTDALSYLTTLLGGFKDPISEVSFESRDSIITPIIGSLASIHDGIINRVLISTGTPIPIITRTSKHWPQPTTTVIVSTKPLKYENQTQTYFDRIDKADKELTATNTKPFFKLDGSTPIQGDLVFGGKEGGLIPEIKTPVIHKLATAPVALTEGQLYYNTTAHLPYFWNATAWTAFSGGVTAHSALTQLDYASAGHTGFASSTDLTSYLPLAAGSGSPLTGDLYIDKTSPEISLRASGGGATYSYWLASPTITTIICPVGHLYLACDEAAHNIYLQTSSSTRLTVADTAITAAVPLAMSGTKITGLAAGTTNGNALRYEQLVGAYLPLSAGSGVPLTGHLWIDTTDPYVELLGDTYGVEIKNNAGDFRVTVAAGKKFQFVVSA